jgi:hypothetical protein
MAHRCEGRRQHFATNATISSKRFLTTTKKTRASKPAVASSSASIQTVFFGSSVLCLAACASQPTHQCCRFLPHPHVVTHSHQPEMLRCNWTLRAGLPARYSPMLASPLTVTASSKKLSRRAKAEGPFYVSPKLDGIRVVYTATGAFTRRGQQIHGLKTIAPILAPLFKADPTLVLDGELYSTQVAQEPGGFENIMSLISKLRRERPKGVEQQLDTLAFHVFDVLQMNKNADRKTSKVLLNNTPFAVRFAALRTLFAIANVEAWAPPREESAARSGSRSVGRASAAPPLPCDGRRRSRHSHAR